MRENELLNGKSFGELRMTGMYDMQEVKVSPARNNVKHVKRQANEDVRYAVRMARPMLHLIEYRTESAAGLTVDYSTGDTHGNNTEVAQLHSWVASARSLHWRLNDARDQLLQGLWELSSILRCLSGTPKPQNPI